MQKNVILSAAGDKEAPLNPQKEASLGPPKGGRKAPLGPPQGGKKSLSIPPRWGRVSLGLIGLMELIGLISLIVEPYGSPKGGGGIFRTYRAYGAYRAYKSYGKVIWPILLTNMAHITDQYGPYWFAAAAKGA